MLIIRVKQLFEQFEEKKGLIIQLNIHSDIERIINNNEVKSYKKTIDYLESL